MQHGKKDKVTVTARGTNYTRYGRAFLLLLLPVVIYLVLICVFTYPLPLKFGSVMFSVTPEISEDAIFPIWYWWHLKTAFSQIFSSPELLWRSDMLYSPFGLAVGNAISNPIPLIILFPVIGFLSFPLNTNAFLVLILLLNGLCTWFMLRKLRFGALESILGGALVTVNPYYLEIAGGGRQEQARVWFISLFIPLAIAALKKGGKKRVLAAVAMLLAASLFYWFHGLFLLILLGAFTLRAGFGTRAPVGRIIPFKRAAAVGLLFLSLCLLLLYPYLNIALKEGKVLGVSPDMPLALKLPDGGTSPEFLPPKGQEQLGTVSDSPGRIIHNPIALFQILLLVPLLFSRKRPTFWILTGLLFYSLSLGPYLKLPFTNIKLVMPFALIYAFVPYGSRLIDTGRFSAVTYLILALLSARAFSFISEKLRFSRLSRLWLLSAFLIVIAVLSRFGGEMPLVPVPTVPEGIQSLRAETGAVIDVPLYSNEVWARAMWYQITHHRPLMLGPGSGMEFARPQRFTSMIAANTMLNYLARYGLEHGESQTASAPQHNEWLDGLEEMGFRFVLYHKKTLEGRLQVFAWLREKHHENTYWYKMSRNLEKVIGVPPVSRGEMVDIYDLSLRRKTKP